MILKLILTDFTFLIDNLLLQKENFVFCSISSWLIWIWSWPILQWFWLTNSENNAEFCSLGWKMSWYLRWTFLEEAGGRVMSTINNLLRALTSLRYTTIVECGTFCSSSPKIRIFSMWRDLIKLWNKCEQYLVLMIIVRATNQDKNSDVDDENDHRHHHKRCPKKSCPQNSEG